MAETGSGTRHRSREWPWWRAHRLGLIFSLLSTGYLFMLCLFSYASFFYSGDTLTPPPLIFHFLFLLDVPYLGSSEWIFDIVRCTLSLPSPVGYPS